MPNGQDPLRRAMGAVSAMLERQQPLEHVEAFIESQRTLEEEERAVLWLYAWYGGEASFMADQLGRVVLGVS